MKRAVLILITVMLFVGTFACDKDPSPVKTYDHDAIVVMGKKTDMEKPYMKKIFERYTSVTGKNINKFEVEDSKFEEEAKKRFVGEGQAPDILLHFNNDDLNRLNVAKNFLYMDEESWVSDITESAAKYCSDREGHLLGLPFWESSVSGCYYNKSLFTEYGIDEIPDTQEEFDALCERLKKEDITPICWPNNGCSWMYQFAIDPIFADEPNGPILLEKLNNGEIGYKDIPAMRQMAEWIVKARDNGWFGDDYDKIGWDDIDDKLNSGRCAMVFIWDTWFYTDFVDGKYKKEDFELMPVFMGTVEGGTYEGGNINMMMINKNSEKLDSAKAFMRFCADPKNYNYAFEGVATVNCFKGQTTTVQSHMVTSPTVEVSIKEKERVSTATTKIAGYNAEDVMYVFRRLFRNVITIDKCLELLDEERLNEKAEEIIPSD